MLSQNVRFQVVSTSFTMATLRFALMHERSSRTNLFVVLLQQRAFHPEQHLLHHGLVVPVVDVHDSVVQSIAPRCAERASPCDEYVSRRRRV